MARIVTLTLNPALDLTARTARVEPTEKLRCSDPRRDPGGGGINVARVVHELGGEALAVMPLGGAAGRQLDALMSDLSVPHRTIWIEGDTRESFSIHADESGEQYRFLLPGPALSTVEVEDCFTALADAEGPVAYFVLSGSLPPGIGAEFVQQFCDFCAQQKTPFAVDMAGPRLTEVRGAALIKPNRPELEALVGNALPTEAEQIAAARTLIAQGLSETVLLSCGGDGALLITAERARAFAPIAVEGDSAVGAGDSMLGACLLALSRGWAIDDAVAYGMAAGAAAFLTPATELVHRDDVARYYAGYRPA